MSDPTPGPWHIGDGTRIIGANSQRVAVCDENHATPGLANAQLIAAAPDLLCSAKQALAVFKAGPWPFPKDPLDIAIKALEAAISKAEEMA